MAEIVVRDMLPEDEYFVSTCSHVNESDETDACGRRRRALFHDLIDRGAVIKAALLDAVRVGFAYGVPIDVASWGPLGEDLMVIPCLYVTKGGTKAGIGRRLIEAIEEDARRSGRKGVTTIGFRDLPGAEWFLPAAFYEHLGYEAVAERDRAILLWRPFVADAVRPRFLEPKYTFRPVPKKLVVDLFWNDFCPTSGIEAQRVRDVCAEFGDRVVLNEFCADDRGVLLECGIERGIYVNGDEIGWGYEAPKDGIREAIARALEAL